MINITNREFVRLVRQAYREMPDHIIQALDNVDVIVEEWPGPEEQDLGNFYRRLAAAEGRHWETFRDLAYQVLPKNRVDQRIEVLAEVEADIVRHLPVEPRMH